MSRFENIYNKFLLIVIMILFFISLWLLYFNPGEWYTYFSMLFAILIAIPQVIISIRTKKLDLSEDYPTYFVDRIEPISQLIEKINCDQKRIFISGVMGIGKTVLLQRFIQECHLNAFKFKYIKPVPIYIELKDDDSLKNCLKNKFNIINNISNKELINKINNLIKGTPIIIVDNLSNKILLDTFEFIDTIQTLDNRLIFIISSYNIEPKYTPIELTKFTSKEIFDMASELNIEINTDTVNKILNYSEGLPIFIKIFLKNYQLTHNLDEIVEIEKYLSKIISDLDENIQILLKNISFYNFYKEKINFSLFRKVYPQYTYANINHLCSMGLIEFQNGMIQMNFNISSFIRKIFDDERYSYYESFIENKKTLNYSDKKYIYLILNCNKKYISIDDMLDYLNVFFINKEYVYIKMLFESIYIIDNLNIQYDVTDINSYFTYYYFHSLLEIGEYPTAIEFIENEENWPAKITLNNSINNLTFDFNFDLADIYHFKGEYRQAIDNFTILQNKSNGKHKVKCLWAISHCYRHIGDPKSLYQSLKIAEEINDKTYNKKESFALYLRNKMSIILINLYLNNISYNYLNEFNELIEFAKKFHLYNYVLEINQSRQRANYYKVIKNDLDKAYNILNEGINVLEDNGLRIKYDYYFEMADVIRKQLITDQNFDKINECYKYFEKAYSFAEKSNDVSLLIITKIGLIILNIQLSRISNQDLDTIIEIATLCKEKNIFYMLNWSILIQEYLHNRFFSHDVRKDDILYNKIINLNLFIM